MLAFFSITTTEYQGVDITLAWFPASTEWNIKSFVAILSKYIHTILLNSTV